MKNRLNITISDIQLTVNTDYDQEKADALANAVTEQMNGILNASRMTSKLDASLLLLLDAFDKRDQLEAECTEMKKKLETMALDLELLRAENEKLTAKEADGRK